MKSIEVEGNSVDEAIEDALRQLNAERDQVEVEVIESGSKGFLGIIGNKSAKVKVSLKKNPTEQIAAMIRKLIEKMGLEVNFELLQAEPYWKLNFYGSDVRILIGHRGETLNALQMIINMFVAKNVDQKIRLIIDAEGYRERREETLVRLARRIAVKVKRYKKNISLEAMTPQERRIIHLALQNDQEVSTISEGEDPYRHVVICLKKEN